MITDIQAKNMKPRERSFMVRDDRGLYLRIDPNGRKHWIFRYWKEGREHQKSIGSYPATSLKAARVLRDELQARREQGSDISTPPRTSPRMKDIVQEWWDVKMAPLSAGYQKSISLRLKRYVLPALGERRITDITSGEVLRVLRQIETAGHVETALRVKVIIGQVFRFAVASDRTDSDPTSSLKGALRTPTPKHFATMTDPEEIRHLVRTMREYPYPIMRAAMLFSILTFARPGEVRAAEWAEIDLDRQEWRIPTEKMKMRRPHIVPLAAQALAVLEELRPITGSGRWLFPSPRNDGRCMSENGVRVALRSMGFTNEQITPHGFRAMFSTWANERNYPPDVIEACLAHQDRNAIRAAYNRAEYLEQRRELLQKWADWLESLAASPPAAGPTSGGREVCHAPDRRAGTGMTRENIEG